MRKKIITGLLFLIMAISLCACTSKEEKAKKNFEEALDAYQVYFDETLKSDYKSQCGARIVLDKDGFPVLFAGGVTGEGEQMSYNTMLYTYKDGKVVSVKEIHNKSYYQMLAYADGIFAIEEKETVKEKVQLYNQNTETIEEIEEENEKEIWKYYQLSGNELVSLDDVIDKEYQKWKTNIPNMLKEKCGDTMGYYELKELLQYLSSEKYYIGDSKEEYAEISKAVKKLFQSIYKKVYGDKVQVSEFSALLDVDSSKVGHDGGHMLASPLVSFEDDIGILAASDFRHFITKLKEKGIMSQEEFIVWNLNFYCENFGAETIMSCALEEYSFVDVIQRNPMLINDIDSEYKKDETDMDIIKEGIIKYAFCNYQLELLNKVDVVKDMKPKEVKEYLLGFFVHYIVQDYCECEGKDFKENATSYINYSPWGATSFDDGTVEQEMEELLNDYIDKNVTGNTNEEMLKSCMDFLEKDLEGVLKDSYAEAVENIESNPLKSNEALEENKGEDLADESMEEWKQVYIDYLSTHADEVGGCELAYLNDDDIPELFVRSEESPSHATKVKIFTVMNGYFAQQIGGWEYGSYGSVQIYEKTGIFKSADSGMGECHNYFYEMKEDGRAEQIAYLYQTDADLPERTKYYIEDTEVTEEQWNSRYAEVEPDSVEEKTVPSEALTAMEMQEEIRNMA